MNSKQITQRATQLEGAIRSFKRTKFMTEDGSGLKGSEKYILWMLATLNNGKPVMPSEAAKELDVTLAAITHHINSLEKLKLLVRSHSSEDRRVIFISLSEKGMEVAEALRNSYWKRICDLVEYLGDGDSAELISLITKISSYFKETGGAVNLVGSRKE